MKIIMVMIIMIIIMIKQKLWLQYVNHDDNDNNINHMDNDNRTNNTIDNGNGNDNNSVNKGSNKNIVWIQTYQIYIFMNRLSRLTAKSHDSVYYVCMTYRFRAKKRKQNELSRNRETSLLLFFQTSAHKLPCGTKRSLPLRLSAAL